MWKARERQSEKERRETGRPRQGQDKGKDHRQVYIEEERDPAVKQPTKQIHIHNEATRDEALLIDGLNSSSSSRARQKPSPIQRSNETKNASSKVCCFYYYCVLLLFLFFIQVSFHFSCMWKPGLVSLPSPKADFLLFT